MQQVGPVTGTLAITIEVVFDINGNWVVTYANGTANNGCDPVVGSNETIVIQYNTQTNTIEHFTFYLLKSESPYFIGSPTRGDGRRYQVPFNFPEPTFSGGGLNETFDMTFHSAQAATGKGTWVYTLQGAEFCRGEFDLTLMRRPTTASRLIIVDGDPLEENTLNGDAPMGTTVSGLSLVAIDTKGSSTQSTVVSSATWSIVGGSDAFSIDSTSGVVPVVRYIELYNHAIH